jgi:SAM-dependent methyltransferase
MTTATLDPTRVDAFEEHLVGLLNGAATCLMLSVGHRTGLLEVLADGRERTVDDLATDASCDRRYVQEWLGAMTVADIVSHDPDRQTYALPLEHAELLAGPDGTANLAVFAQYIPLLGSVEDDIVDCFRTGGGVAYDRYPRFHEVMEQDSGQTVLPALIDHILPLAPEVIDRLQQGIHVIDVGCGRGRALRLLGETFPASTFVGYDLSPDAIAHAAEQARHLDNVSFEVADATSLGEHVTAGSVGLALTFDAVHDQARPDLVLQAIRTSLRPDGVYLAQDIDATSTHHGDRDHPLGPLLYAVSCLHCMTVSLAQDGAGLGAMWGRERATAHFQDAGFGTVEVHTLDHDPQNAYYVCRP